MSLSRAAARRCLYQSVSRVAAPAASATQGSSSDMLFKSKAEGDISAGFNTLLGKRAEPLPDRFLAMKAEIVAGNEVKLQASWDRLVEALKVKTDEIATRKQDIIPKIPFKDIKAGTVNPSLLARVRSTGVAVVQGVLPKNESADLLAELIEYVKGGRLKGYPSDAAQKVVYESYWSPTQVKARSHPDMLATQRFMNRFYHSTQKGDLFDLDTPVTYADRVTIRPPGDAQFKLSSHIDGGGIERWEDPSYRSTYRHILSGDWEKYDVFDLAGRNQARSDMYGIPNAASVFRTFQAWVALTPNFGTLRVLPTLKEATAYLMLRPFFQPTRSDGSLDGWKFSLTEPNGDVFVHGASPGMQQELNPIWHPHLQLEQTMTANPEMKAGDMVFWTSDQIHSTADIQPGKEDAVVLYIASTPLTMTNARYLRHQRECFLAGRPPADFPGGEGESTFTDRATPATIKNEEGLRCMGLAPMQGADDAGISESARRMRLEADKVLGFA